MLAAQAETGSQVIIDRMIDPESSLKDEKDYKDVVSTLGTVNLTALQVSKLIGAFSHVFTAHSNQVQNAYIKALSKVASLIPKVQCDLIVDAIGAKMLETGPHSFVFVKLRGAFVKYYPSASEQKRGYWLAEFIEVLKDAERDSARDVRLVQILADLTINLNDVVLQTCVSVMKSIITNDESNRFDRANAINALGSLAYKMKPDLVKTCVAIVHIDTMDLLVVNAIEAALPLLMKQQQLAQKEEASTASAKPADQPQAGGVTPAVKPSAAFSSAHS